VDAGQAIVDQAVKCGSRAPRFHGLATGEPGAEQSLADIYG